MSATYGAKAAEATPPIKRMMEAGIPVGAGTDATRVASYNPWVSLSWLVTGKTLGGTTLYPVRNRLDRETALRMWTEKNTWFSNEVGKKGQIKAGQLALPKPMPDWSPVATFGGHYRRPEGAQKMAAACGCTNACNVHGHDHAAALGANIPAADVQSFWGAFGCGCWAV